jgi:hypothetical protein
MVWTRAPMLCPKGAPTIWHKSTAAMPPCSCTSCWVRRGWGCRPYSALPLAITDDIRHQPACGQLLGLRQLGLQLLSEGNMQPLNGQCLIKATNMMQIHRTYIPPGSSPAHLSGIWGALVAHIGPFADYSTYKCCFYPLTTNQTRCPQKHPLAQKRWCVLSFFVSHRPCLGGSGDRARSKESKGLLVLVLVRCALCVYWQLASGSTQARL